MPEAIIRRGAVEPDHWTFVGPDPGAGADSPLPEGPIAVALAFWKSHREALLARGTALGVWLAPADEPAELAGDFARLSLVAIHFPKFTDGRGYSNAVLVRRGGYRGELRAFGDIGRDQLFYLSRCGFDSYALRPGADPRDALPSLGDFSVRYQAGLDERVPLFRRRALAEAAR